MVRKKLRVPRRYSKQLMHCFINNKDTALRTDISLKSLTTPVISNNMTAEGHPRRKNEEN